MQRLDQSSPDELAARVADHSLFRDFATRHFMPAEPNLVHAMWAAMISAARANGQTVSIVHDETSGQIGSVTIGTNPFL